MIKKFVAHRLGKFTMSLMHRHNLDPQRFIEDLKEREMHDVAAIYQKELNKIILREGK